MKKQYIFLILIVIMLYSIFLISTYKYKEYKVNIHLDSLADLINEIKYNIATTQDLIEYKKSLAYRNKVLKSEQWLKNKWETVIYLTPEKKYNKFVKESITKDEIKAYETLDNIDETTKYMTIYEKWMYLLFKKSANIN